MVLPDTVNKKISEETIASVIIQMGDMNKRLDLQDELAIVLVPVKEINTKHNKTQ